MATMPNLPTIPTTISAWQKLGIVALLTVGVMISYLLMTAMWPFVISLQTNSISDVTPYAGNFTTFIPTLKAVPLWMFMSPMFVVLVVVAGVLRMPEGQ